MLNMPILAYSAEATFFFLQSFHKAESFSRFFRALSILGENN